MKARVGATILLTAVLVASGSQADSITHGGTTINMDFVDIGYAGNAGDTTNTVNGLNPGSVDYNYRFGQYEVTAAQWASVIAADPNVGNGGGNSGSYPSSYPNWYEAAKFCNWLTSGSYSNGAYQFSDPNTLTNINRAAALSAYEIVYVLPTEDEWYKAAFYKSDGSGYTRYATGDSVPGAGSIVNYLNGGGGPWPIGTGGIADNNGTFDMNGNLWEWTESAQDGTLDSYAEGRSLRGGSFGSTEVGLRSSAHGSDGLAPTVESEHVGFRVAGISFEALIFNAVEVGWTSVSGATYQVRYSTNLASGNWFDLGEPVVGNGSTNYVFDSTRGTPKRFYRVISE